MIRKNIHVSVLFLTLSGTACGLANPFEAAAPKSAAPVTPASVTPNKSPNPTVIKPTVPTAPVTPDDPQDPNATQALPPANDANSTLPVTQPYTLVGRFDSSNPNSPQFAWPNSRIGANFTGSSLAVRLQDSGTDVFNVVIDGGTATVVETQANTTQTYTLASGLTPGHHTVWMTKRTEFYQGSTGNTHFLGFQLDPNGTFLQPPAARTRHIDFIGDSGFTGYGAGEMITGGNDCPDGFTAENEDATQSIPQFTGDLLNADIVNASSSGQAVYLSVFDTNAAHLLPAMYQETLPPATAPAWTFSGVTADAIVISAGGDDLAGDSGSGYFPDPNAFVTTYANWLATLRRQNPNAVIVCVLSQSAKNNDITVLGGALQKAVSIANGRGDANVYYYSYFTGDTQYHTYDDVASQLQLYWGCGYHPSPKGAQFLAKRLASFIAGKKNW